MKPDIRKKIRLYGSIFLAVGVTAWALVETGPKYTFMQWKSNVLAGGHGMQSFCLPQGRTPTIYSSFMYPRSVEITKIDYHNLEEAEVFFEVESMNLQRDFITIPQKAKLIRQDNVYCIQRMTHI